MANVVNTNNTSEIEDVVEVPVANNYQEASLTGPWDDESFSIEERRDLLSKEVERLENESIVKRYQVRGGLDFGQSVKKFIHDRVKWRYVDSFLVVNSYNEIEQAIKECRKTQVFEISGIFVEPLLQMLQSAEGVGYESAKNFYENLLVPISETANSYRKDAQTLQNLKLKLGSLENNIDPNKIEEVEE